MDGHAARGKGDDTMRSGSNWVFLRGTLGSVTTRTTRAGQQVSEVRLVLPLGRHGERTVMTVPAFTWDSALAAQLAALPRGTTLELTGHISSRRWTTTAGAERFAGEVSIDHVGVDIGHWLRQDGAALADRTEKEN
jgi:hypothetical protein